jgi:c(7)-type cytochrome triheme protein
VPDVSARKKGLPLDQHALVARQWLSLIILAVGFAGFILTFVFNERVSALPADSPDQEMLAETNSTEMQEGGVRSSDFSHANAAHARLPCLLCHKREGNSPQPSRSGHLPCAGCHKQEFASASGPICAVCHTDTQSGEVKPFPGLKSFTVHFDHAEHTGVGRTRSGCTNCHRPTMRGVAFSIPAGQAAHSTCFQCHTPEAIGRTGEGISSCNTCHSLGRFTRTPQWSRAYKINFSHADHGTRRGLNCNDCHSVRAGLPQRRQVSAPIPAMHAASARAQSCMACHNDKRAFGISDFKNCRRCHEGPDFSF